MGFLSNLLPAIAGGALAATGIGAPAAAAMLGGLQYARTGSLQKGMAAGLGAYGGYGLGEGLAASGATTVPEGAQMAAGAGDPTAGVNAMSTGDKMRAGISGLASEQGRNAFMQNVGNGSGLFKTGLAATAPALMATSNQPQVNTTDANMGRRYAYSPGARTPTPAPDINPNIGGGSGREQRYYSPSYRTLSDEEAKSIYGFADGGGVQATKADPLAFYHARQAEAAAAPAPKQIDVAAEYENYVKGLNPAPAPANPNAGKIPEVKPIQYQYDPNSPDFTPDQARANLQTAMQSVGDWAAEYNKNNPTPERVALKPRGTSGIQAGLPYSYNPNTQTFAGTQAPTMPAAQATPAPAAPDNSPNDLSTGMAGGGPVEAMSNANALGQNTGFPQADINRAAYSTPWQTPISQNVVEGTADTGVNRMTGDMLATGGIADAHYNLGGYSDGGRLLRGPGDGVSDSIPAVIGHKKPARLADGEFVVPARIVSELGNGSTEAGARKLYAMLDRVQSARKQSIGKGKVAKNSRADKYLPA